MLDWCCLFLAEIPCACNVGTKYRERFPEKLFITFLTFARLVMGVRWAKLSPGGRFCLENYPSSLCSAPFENDNVTQKPGLFHTVEGMLCFWQRCHTAYSTMEQQFWETSLRNSFQSSFANTGFKEVSKHIPVRWRMNVKLDRKRR